MADENIENARIGYQVATNLWIYEGNTAWAIFNAMLVANSIVLAAEGIGSGLVKKWFPVIGFVLCIMWYSLNSRGLQVHDYRVHVSREIEEMYLRPVNILSRGAKFHNGDNVNVFIGGRLKPLKLSGFGRIRANFVTKGAIFIFAVLHIVLYIVE
jgi:hypothetical protein